MYKDYLSTKKSSKHGKEKKVSTKVRNLMKLVHQIDEKQVA